MTNNQMREDFEDFASDQYEWPQAIQKSADGGYKLMATAEGWRYWQASRAALCVELPFEACNGAMNGNRVREAIESTGVRTK